MHHKLNSISGRSVSGLIRLAAVGVLATLLSACGGGGGGGGSDKSAQGGANGGNNAPTLTGTPSANAQVGAPYTVAPSAQDADGDMLAFSIQNLPRWAQFNTATGQLTGTPSASDVGVYADVLISVSDGKSEQSLPQFTITVAQGGSGGASPGGSGTRSAMLQWQPPKVGADTVAGYRIHYGTDEGTLTETINVPNAGILNFVVENLAPGTYFFAISAINNRGLESQLSNRLTKSIS